MPANTTHGLPYPLPTEPVAEGAQAIRNLAEALDGKLPVPRCQVIVAQNVASGSWTAMNWGSGEDFDPDGMHDPAVNPARVTAKAAGWYLAFGYLTHGAVNTAGARRIAICKNPTGGGNGIVGSQTASAAQTTNAFIDLNAVASVNLAVNDWLELHEYQDSGASLAVQARLLVMRYA